MRRLLLLVILGLGAASAAPRATQAAPARADNGQVLLSALNTAVAGNSAIARVTPAVSQGRWNAARQDAAKALTLYHTARRQAAPLTASPLYAHVGALLNSILNAYVQGASVTVNGAARHNVALVRRGLLQIQAPAASIAALVASLTRLATGAAQLARASAAYRAGLNSVQTTAARGVHTGSALPQLITAGNWTAAQQTAQQALTLFQQAAHTLAGLKPPISLRKVQSTLARGLAVYVSGMTAALKGTQAHNTKQVLAGIKQLDAGTALVQQAATLLKGA
jgi:hypothetical protein